MTGRRAATYLAGAVAHAAVILAATQPVGVQSVDRRTFTARSTGSNEAGCSFRARDNLTSQLARRTFVTRPPGQTLTFSVVTGQTMTAAAIDARLETASQFLQQNNGGTDVNCCVEIRRTGAVGTFAQPAGMVGGVVANAGDLANVNAIAADVKIVAAIGFCGGTGTFAGCRSGNSLVVTVGFPAATIAHEFGHMQGLCHVGTNCTPTCGQAGQCTGCADPSASNIMWFQVCNAIAQDRITATQCSNFRNGAAP